MHICIIQSKLPVLQWSHAQLHLIFHSAGPTVGHTLRCGVGEGGWGKGGLGNGGDHECSRRCQELHLSLLYFVADCVSTPHMAQAISDVVG